MKLNRKIFISLIFIMGFISLLIGSFAYYRIIVSGSINGTTGNAVFVLRDTVAGESWNNKVINLGKINPGDSGSFDVVMDASESDVDMYATLKIDRGTGDTELPKNLKFYTTPDYKSELHKYYSFLEKNKTNKEKITLYWYWNPYNSDEEDNMYVNKTITANITVTAVQISEYATMSEFSTNKAFWQEKYSPYVRTINFSNDLSNLPSSCTETNLCWDISFDSSQKKKVYGYLVDTGLKDSIDNTKSLYNLYIVSKAPIFAPADSSSMFMFQEYSVEHNKYISNLISINFNNNFNTSNVTSMYNMFNHCTALTTLDLSSFNIVNVTSMSGMFYACESLISLNLSNFNTTNVKNMGMMFCNCTSLTNLDFSSFNTLKLENLGGMFSYCSSLNTVNLNNFNTTNVVIMSSWFENCTSLTNLDLSNLNTKNVTSMYSMFKNCSSLTSLNLSNFNISKVTGMSSMFEGCSSLTSLNLSSFNTAKVEDMSNMFDGCLKLQTQINIMNPNIKNYSNMFQGAASDPTAHIIIGYTTETQTIAQAMRNTCTDESAKVRIELKKID